MHDTRLAYFILSHNSSFEVIPAPCIHLFCLQSYCDFFFLSKSLTVGVSRLMEVQMDLPRLLFGVGFFFRIFIVMPQMFTFSLEYAENV